MGTNSDVKSARGLNQMLKVGGDTAEVKTMGNKSLVKMLVGKLDVECEWRYIRC